MPTLTLKFKDNVLGTFSIKKGKSLTIGRKESNDITVENLAVSGHHAKVDAVGDGFLLTDLQSKNGTFINEQLVQSHWLKHNDLVVIGKHTLVFAFDEGEQRPEGAGTGMEQTMVMDTDKYREMLSHAMKAPGAAVPVAAASQKIGILAYLSGGQGEVELTKKLFKIGKNQACDIVVKGLLMGQTAATISQRPNGYSLSYVEGMTKPKVNGTSVKESVMLKEFDQIEVGGVKFQFSFKG